MRVPITGNKRVHIPIRCPTPDTAYASFVLKSHKGSWKSTSFDGVPYFYIISLRELIAGMTYKVQNITLKNLGSRYSNKYIQKYATDAAIESVAEWSELQMDNIQVGYTEDGYDIYGYE